MSAHPMLGEPVCAIHCLADKVIMKRLAISGLLAAALAGSAGLALAQDVKTPEAPVETPDEPVVTSDYQRGANEPQVVITGDKDATFYEYRVNGELREIKVVPKVGPPYYLVPAPDGWIRQDQSQVRIPSWVIFSW